MLRFMPVGDSMTIGSAGERTWRYRFWQHLRATYDGPFGIVGPRETLYDKATNAPTSYEYADADPGFPRAHLAGWGEGWLHMAPLIADAVRTHRADVLLVSLGLIDLGFYTNAEQTAENTRRFVEAAREAAPHIRMVLLPVIPNVRAESDAPFAAEVARFNELLAKAAADLDEPRSPLLLASPPPSYDIHRDTYDGTHPNASGEHKIAATFADAMHEAWDLGGPYELPYS
ncbi:SGNH/GDSL hydrolase family protein [Streptomyces caniscabiei]|uniref:SGNH/GDSL hydrolase family protein n=2 Tax=Streptomyces caniscabiei TaxID=2746961 RepID=UPI0029BA76E9|nr:SGNH/GDSL hydrolase family protein [Streptomyces caniscabiei]MDX2602957.1 SGNH/GDSL hydrolase family protein [Streptomyces caniscabiei]MDX2737756.1 SGNH/GDSL hydrolase family protein [Streptomyces caniscabiei]